MIELRARAINYIEETPYALLVTVGKGNVPSLRHIGPFFNNGLDIYIMTNLDSKKVRDIDSNPCVAVYFQKSNQETDGPRSVILLGKASLVPKGGELDLALRHLAEKSPYFRNVSQQKLEGWAVYKISGKSLKFTDGTKVLSEEL